MGEHEAALGAAGLLHNERRRPGRMDRVSEELIPLLRRSRALDLAHDEDGLGPQSLSFDDDGGDQLRAAKGVMLGAAIGLTFWISAFGVAAWLLGG